MPAREPDELPASGPQLATLGIEIELGSAPIRGRVWDGDRTRATPFCGWLELADRIEGARLSPAPDRAEPS